MMLWWLIGMSVSRITHHGSCSVGCQTVQFSKWSRLFDLKVSLLFTKRRLSIFNDWHLQTSTNKFIWHVKYIFPLLWKMLAGVSLWNENRLARGWAETCLCWCFYWLILTLEQPIWLNYKPLGPFCEQLSKFSTWFHPKNAPQRSECGLSTGPYLKLLQACIALSWQHAFGQPKIIQSSWYQLCPDLLSFFYYVFCYS